MIAATMLSFPNEHIIFKLLVSKNLQVRSSEPVPTPNPSGKNETELTSEVCPRSVIRL